MPSSGGVFRSGGGGAGISPVIDTPYSVAWLGDTTHSPSANQLYIYLNSLGLPVSYNRVWFFSSAVTTAFGEVGNPLKPFGENFIGTVVNSLAQVGDTIIFLGGNFTTGNFLYPIKNTTIILINSTLNGSGINGLFLGFRNVADPNRCENITVYGIGNSFINKTNTNNGWSVISAFNYLKIKFVNLTINSYGVIGRNTNASNEHLISFFNCNLNILDNDLPSINGVGFTEGMIEFIDSNITGLIAIGQVGIGSPFGGSAYGYQLRAIRSNFTALSVLSSPVITSIGQYKDRNYIGQDLYIENCNFTSVQSNIIINTLDPLYVPIAPIIIIDSQFKNNLANGMIENLILTGQQYKLRNNYTVNNNTGAIITNSYLGAGNIVEPLLQF